VTHAGKSTVKPNVAWPADRRTALPFEYAESTPPGPASALQTLPIARHACLHSNERCMPCIRSAPIETPPNTSEPGDFCFAYRASQSAFWYDLSVSMRRNVLRRKRRDVFGFPRAEATSLSREGIPQFHSQQHAMQWGVQSRTQCQTS
jgi:hypothetical protein